MVSFSSVYIPKFTPVKKGHWNRLTLFIFQQIKFFVWSFVFFVFYLLWCWTKPLCQSNPLAGKDLQPAKKEKIQVRTKLRQQLSSCLLDLVVVHIFFNLLEKYRVIFYWSSQKSMRDPCLPIVKVGVCIPPLPMDRGWWCCWCGWPRAPCHPIPPPG